MKFRLVESISKNFTVNSYIDKIKTAYENFDSSDITLKDIEDQDRTKFRVWPQHDCAAFVGCMSKSMDKFGIDHTIHIGLALPEKLKKPSPAEIEEMQDILKNDPDAHLVNHCWIVSNNKVYEIHDLNKGNNYNNKYIDIKIDKNLIRGN